MADAPTIVRLPPRQAPSDSATHRGSGASPPSASRWTIGIAVAVYGMLSTRADTSPENQSSAIVVAACSPPVALAIASATSRTSPTDTIDSTSTNRPMKKNNVDHSTSRSISWGFRPATSIRTVAPRSAIVAASSPSVAWNRKPTIVPPVTISDFTSSGRSRMASASVPARAASWRSLGTRSSPRNRTPAMTTNTARITTATGATCTRKSSKPRPAAEPIRMFGGSPIRVAVPPMFEARTCDTR